MDIASLTDNYANMLLSIKAISPLSILSVFFLALARLLPIVYIAPFFGSKIVPAAVRILFSISMLAIFMPQILFSIKGEIAFDLIFVGYFIKEIVIGFILALLVTVPFYVAQSSGTLVDYMRGAQSLQVTDPTISTQTSPVGMLYNYILIVVFFAVGGPFFFIDSISKSYHLIPVDKFFNSLFFSMNIPIWKLLIGLLNYILTMAIQLGAPAIIGILMTEMFLGIANRLAPQVQIVFLGMPLKSWVGLALLAVAWSLVLQQLGKESNVWLKVIDNAIIQAAPK
jgi:type III secretion protein T